MFGYEGVGRSLRGLSTGPEDERMRLREGRAFMDSRRAVTVLAAWFGCMLLGTSHLSCQGLGLLPVRPNILLVTFDTTRWDHVGWAGHPGTTPMLDAMARRGTWFSQAFSAQPLTLPSHTSIMTGLFPYHHGVRNNGTYIVSPDEETLAERLKAAGYQTQAVISAFVLDSQFGLDQGFDGYDDDLSGGPRQAMFMFKEIKAEQTAAKGALWLRNRARTDQPFFLWLHFFDPHANYEPPADIAAKFPGDPYSGEIAYADRELGRVFQELDALHQLDNTLVIFTSDHGDSLGEHGEKTHGLFVYDATTRVPLLMSGPGVPPGKQVDGVVRSVDIVPTVLDLLGLPGQEKLDGRSLKPLWQGQKDDRLAYSETFTPKENFGWSELRAMRSPTLRAIQAPRPELYDRSTDTSEQQNLFGTASASSPPALSLFQQLDQLKQADETGPAKATGTLTDEARRKLSALGYVTDTAHGTATGPLADPKDRIQSWELFQQGQDLVRMKQYELAVQRIRELLASDPGNVPAKGSLAQALVALGRRDEALAVYREMIAQDPRNDTPHLASARILREARQFSEAEAQLRTVLELQPKNPDGYTAMGDLFIEQNQFAEAEKWFRKALEVDAHSTLAAGGLGNCLNRANRLDEARAVLTAARTRDPSSHTVVYNLGVVTERLKDLPGALALFQQAVQLDPDHSMSWNNLGSILQRTGKPAEALKFIQKAHELDADNVEALYNLGTLLVSLKRPEEALPLLEQAEQKRPELIQSWLLHARTLEALGRVPEAVAVLSRLAERNPPAWLAVARLTFKHGDQAQTRAALKRGLEADGERFRAAASRDEALKKLMTAL